MVEMAVALLGATVRSAVFLINLITAKRKNQHKKNTAGEKLILKKRYLIENVFAKIKKFNRIHVRRDKLIVTYMGFVHIALMKIL
jgi:transposase